MLAYIQSEYVFGAAEASATCACFVSLSIPPLTRSFAVLRNKFSHTLTLFFLCTYIDQWPSFFTDLFTCIQPAEGSSERTFNRHVSLLFFRVMLEISGEVADQLIKTARTFNAERHARDGRVRDAVRERDAPRINEAVLTIVSDAARRMETLRKDGSASRETEEVEEMVDLGIRTFGSYVGACAVLYARLWLTSFDRLDRHQPDCDADDCAPLVHAARRLLPSHPSRDLCLFVAHRVKRLERARRQATTSQNSIPWASHRRSRNEDTRTADREGDRYRRRRRILSRSSRQAALNAEVRPGRES